MATDAAKRSQGIYVAGADLSAVANLGKCVKLDTSAADTVTLVAVLGARADGVLMNRPGLGQAAVVDEDGVTKALAGNAIASAGLELTPDATGRLITAVSTNVVFAISRHSVGAANEWVGIKITGPYVKP